VRKNAEAPACLKKKGGRREEATTLLGGGKAPLTSLRKSLNKNGKERSIGEKRGSVLIL